MVIFKFSSDIFYLFLFWYQLLSSCQASLWHQYITNINFAMWGYIQYIFFPFKNLNLRTFLSTWYL